MYEVILYAIMATLVCSLLYFVLGKSVGQGPEAGFDPSALFTGQAEAETPEREFEKEQFSNIPGLEAIVRAESSFSIKHFVDGAKAAYSLILEAFASGDKTELKLLLTPSVYKTYLDAINMRETEGLTQVTDLGRLISADIISAEKKNNKGFISVKFEAELTSTLIDGQGELVKGDPDVLSHITETWTFERKLNSADPNWLLSDVAPSDGDILEADPTPDTVTNKAVTDKKT